MKTPWFNASKHKPVRDGWYEVYCRRTTAWSQRLWWDGKWREKRGDQYSCYFGFSCDCWRGIRRGS